MSIQVLIALHANILFGCVWVTSCAVTKEDQIAAAIIEYSQAIDTDGAIGIIRHLRLFDEPYEPRFISYVRAPDSLSDIDYSNVSFDDRNNKYLLTTNRSFETCVITLPWATVEQLLDVEVNESCVETVRRQLESEFGPPSLTATATVFNVHDVSVYIRVDEILFIRSSISIASNY